MSERKIEDRQYEKFCERTSELRRKWDELLWEAEKLYQEYVQYLEKKDMKTTREERILGNIVAVLGNMRGEVYLLESLMKMKQRYR